MSSTSTFAPSASLETRWAWSQRRQILTSTPGEVTHLREAHAHWVEAQGLDLRSLHPGRASFTNEPTGELTYHLDSSCRSHERRGSGCPLPHPAITAPLCRDCHTARDLIAVPLAANLATSRFLEDYLLDCLRDASSAAEVARALRELSCHAVFTPGHQGLRSDPYSERLPAQNELRPQQAAWVQKLIDTQEATDRAHVEMLRDGTIARVVELYTGTPAGDLVWFVVHSGLHELAVKTAGAWAFTWRTRAEHENVMLVEAPRAAHDAAGGHVLPAETAMPEVGEPVLIGALAALKAGGYDRDTTVLSIVSALV